MKTLKYNTLYLFAILCTFALSFSSCDNDDDVNGGVKRISVKSLPKVAYVLGEKLDISNVVLTIEKGSMEMDVPFSEFAANEITVEPANGTVLNFDNEYLTIKHTPSGKGVTQAIAVTNHVVKVEVKTAPKAKYYAGDKLDLSDLVLLLTLEDGSTNELAFADFGKKIECIPAHNDVLSTELDMLLINFLSTKVEGTFAIEVNAFEPVSASVHAQPAQNTYDIGDFLKLEGLEIKYAMSDGGEIIIPFEDFGNYGIEASPANEEKLGAANTEVEVKHVASDVSTIVPLTINPLLVTNMTLKFKPNKTKYEIGETIDLSGAVVTLSIEGKEDVDVAAADFPTFGIVTNPADGVVYSEDMLEIVISYPGYANTLSIPLGSIIMYESDFTANGTAGWAWNQNGGGSVNVSIVDGELVADDIVQGANGWDVQLMIPGLTIEQGEKYKYTIIIKAAPNDGDNWLGLSLGDGDGRHGWGAYDGGNGVWLGSDYNYQTVEKEFVMGQTTTDAGRLVFDIGNSTKGIIIKYVKIEKL